MEQAAGATITRQTYFLTKRSVGQTVWVWCLFRFLALMWTFASGKRGKGIGEFLARGGQEKPTISFPSRLHRKRLNLFVLGLRTKRWLRGFSKATSVIVYQRIWNGALLLESQVQMQTLRNGCIHGEITFLRMRRMETTWTKPQTSLKPAKAGGNTRKFNSSKAGLLRRCCRWVP